MGFRYSELGRLVSEHPADARARIEVAFMAAGGSRQGAAEQLGVTSRSLARWITRLEEAGYPVRARRNGPGKPSTTPWEEKKTSRPKARKRKAS